MIQIQQVKRKGHIVLMCILLSFLVQGCVSGGHKKCDGAGLMCKDKSTPVEGKCSDGSEATLALACMQMPASCGSKCYSWQEGRTGCDTNNPNAKCTTTNYPNGSCYCACL
jgi:hypothetical protein